jgi:hypothetical protein
MCKGGVMAPAMLCMLACFPDSSVVALWFVVAEMNASSCTAQSCGSNCVHRVYLVLRTTQALHVCANVLLLQLLPLPWHAVQVYPTVQLALPTPEGYHSFAPPQQQQAPGAAYAAALPQQLMQQQGFPEPPPGATVTYNITHVTNNYGGGSGYPEASKGAVSPGAAVSVYQEGYGAGLAVGPQPARVEGAGWGGEGGATAPPMPGMMGYQQATY